MIDTTRTEIVKNGKLVQNAVLKYNPKPNHGNGWFGWWDQFAFSLHDSHLHDSKWQVNERTLGSEMTDSCLKGFSQIFAQTALLYKLSIALPSSNLVLFFGQTGTHTGVSIE